MKKISKKKVKTNEQNESESSCSSRYSNTDSSKNEDSEEEDDSTSDESESEEEDEEIYANIFKFPVQTIALECCDDTLDSYIISIKLKMMNGNLLFCK